MARREAEHGERTRDLAIRDAVGADIVALCALCSARSTSPNRRRRGAGAGRFLVAVTGGTIIAFAIVLLRHPVKDPPKSHVRKLSDAS